MTETVSAKTMAAAVRALSMDAVERAKSGHPGMPMGMADIAVTLFTRHLRHNPADPKWPARDRFILSNGHGSMLQYSMLHLTGYDVSIEDIKNFRQGELTVGIPVTRGTIMLPPLLSAFHQTAALLAAEPRGTCFRSSPLTALLL